MAKPVSVVFIHGLAKKPAPEKLMEIWQWGLSRGNPMPSTFPPPNAGLELSAKGVRQRLNYYADVFYGEDYETEVKSYYESDSEKDVLAADGLDAPDAGLPQPVPQNERERAFLTGFETKLAANLARMPVAAVATPVAAAGTSSTGPDSAELEIAKWLPPIARQAIIKKAAMEAFYYLFDKEFVRKDGTRFFVRKELRNRLLADLAAARDQSDRVVVISHSMGTMVAYDVLRNCPECPKVDVLITLGSPLGVREVQVELAAKDSDGVDFPAATLDRWVNIYDPLDPVCGADPKFNDFRAVDGKKVVDIKESNWGGWRHTITHYLAGSKFREELRRALGWS